MTVPATDGGAAVRPRSGLERAFRILSVLGLVAAVLALVAGLGGLVPAAGGAFIGFGLLALTLESRRTGRLALRYGRVSRETHPRAFVLVTALYLLLATIFLAGAALFLLG